jgi:hypothetical protein
MNNQDKATILGQVFQKTQSLIGANFKQITEEFSDIDLVSFPSHLKKYQIFIDYPFIHDIAQLEYYLHHSYQERPEELTELEIEAFLEALEIEPDAITLIINPTVRIFKSNYPIDKIFGLKLDEIKEKISIKSTKANYFFATIINQDFPEIIELMPETFETIELSLLNSQLEEIYADIFEDKSPKIFEKVLREMIDNNILMDFELSDFEGE